MSRLVLPVLNLRESGPPIVIRARVEGYDRQSRTGEEGSRDRSRMAFRCVNAQKSLFRKTLILHGKLGSYR